MNNHNMNNQEAIALFEKHEFDCQECACRGECNKVNCKDKQAFDLAIKALKLYPFITTDREKTIKKEDVITVIKHHQLMTCGTAPIDETRNPVEGGYQLAHEHIIECLNITFGKAAADP